MTLFVGLDDTDSRRTMCTTYLATELVTRLHAHGWDLVGFPRLVRLNPSIPWKTRGNGALCLRFDRGEGASRPVGAFPDRTVEAYAAGAGAPPTEAFFRVCRETLLELADLADPGTQPGLVVTRTPPEVAFYWRAVREVVGDGEVRPGSERADFTFAPKGPRGLIGALAALAWRPTDRTFEVLAYRHSSRWGTHRLVHEADVAALHTRFPRTFNNYDEESGQVAIAPRSPCPVLFGIRGEGPEELPAAMATVRGEPLDRWMVFETNQGTDDHLVPRKAGELRAHTSAIVEGRVAGGPQTVRGGHVVFPLNDGAKVDCVAYEPSKSFRRVVRRLRAGDRIRAYGSVRGQPRALNLEKLEVLALEEAMMKVGNPRCFQCGKSMKSRGRGGGYRCRRCGTRRGASEARFVRHHRDLLPGIYEPPVSARRHLSKPLSRLVSGRVSRVSVLQEALATARMDSATMSSPASISSSSMVRAGM